MTMPRLAITGLTKRFGAVVALDRVSLQVQPAEVVALVGESGAGKSTLLRCAVGVVPWDAGDVEHDGQRLAGLASRPLRSLRRRAQLVMQDAALALDPRQRIGDCLAEARAIHGLSPRDDLLSVVDLELDLARRYPHQVSGGQRQRVLLARALAVEPDLLLLDEPTAMLDSATREHILALLARVIGARRLTAVVATHDADAAARLAHRIVPLGASAPSVA